MAQRHEVSKRYRKDAAGRLAQVRTPQLRKMQLSLRCGRAECRKRSVPASGL